MQSDARRKGLRSVAVVMAVLAATACTRNATDPVISSSVSSTAPTASIASMPTSPSADTASSGAGVASVNSTGQTSPPSATPAGSSAGPVTARLSFPPGCLTFTSAVEFGATASNGTGADIAQVAWLVKADPFPGGVGPHGVLAASLEQRQISADDWQSATLIQEGDDASLASHDWPAASLEAGGTQSHLYRLQLRGIGGNGGTTTISLLLVDIDSDKIITKVSQSLCVTN